MNCLHQGRTPDLGTDPSFNRGVSGKRTGHGLCREIARSGSASKPCISGEGHRDVPSAKGRVMARLQAVGCARMCAAAVPVRGAIPRASRSSSLTPRHPAFRAARALQTGLRPAEQSVATVPEQRARPAVGPPTPTAAPLLHAVCLRPSAAGRVMPEPGAPSASIHPTPVPPRGGPARSSRATR